MPYGTAAGLTTYANVRGWDISGLASDAAKTAELAKASTYVDGLGYVLLSGGRRASIWPGERVSADQIDEWPRSGATTSDGREIPEDSVPLRIEYAAYEAVYAVLNGGADLNRSQSADQTVVREKVDVIEVQYADPTSAGDAVDTRARIEAVDTLLAPLLSGEGRFGITMVMTS